MSKKTGFLVGALVGAAAALFLAPKKGSELREGAGKIYDDLKENPQETLTGMRDTALDFSAEKFNEIKEKKFDGFIITGAPVEQMPFEEVDYWEELTEIMEWSRTHVTSTLHLCWGAQAGIYYHYGIDKVPVDRKVFGIFRHKVMNRKIPLVRGFDDVFLAPHSRHTEVPLDKIRAEKRLTILAESEEAGLFLAMAEGGRQIFVMGHPEYDRVTLDGEYKRDLQKGLPIDIPKNYYADDNPNNRPLLTWRAAANNLYTNWLNYYVYQVTPYDLYGTPF